MDINNWITFAADAKKGEGEELEDLVQTRLAKQVQTRLRGQVDSGIDLKSARRAQAIRVQAQGGSIIIDEEDQGAILGGEPEESKDDSEPPAANLDDLYRPSSGVPQTMRRPDGTTQLVFRSISASAIFGEQTELRQDEAVERAIADTLRTRVVEAFEESFSELERLSPGDDG